MRCRVFLLALVVLVTGCAKAPPNLSPTGARTYQANQAVVALGTVLHAAIELNKVQVCTPMPCHPLLSDQNTKLVGDNISAALNGMRGVPSGWKATALSALTTVQQRLDETGKATLAQYVSVAISIVNGLTGDTP